MLVTLAGFIAGSVVGAAHAPGLGSGDERVGPPYVASAVGLALANFATLALAGRPWGITSGFARGVP